MILTNLAMEISVEFIYRNAKLTAPHVLSIYYLIHFNVNCIPRFPLLLQRSIIKMHSLRDCIFIYQL